MAKLCQALREDTKLVLIGDADQLAPVQGGAVFNGLIQSYQRNEFPEENSVRRKSFQSLQNDRRRMIFFPIHWFT